MSRQEESTPARGGSVTLRLVRREARGDLPLLACLALLVAVLTALCALGPALVGRQEDRALRQRIDAAQAQAPLLTVSTVPVFPEPSDDPHVAPALPMSTLLAAGRQLTGRLGGPAGAVVPLATGGSYDYEAAGLSSPRPPDRTVTEAKLTISHLPDAAGHLQYLSGSAPADRTPSGGVPQIALSQATAQALGVRTGSRLSLRFVNQSEFGMEPPADTALVVSGIFQPTQSGDGFWDAQSSLVQPLQYPEQNTSGTVLAARGLVGADTADLLTRAGVPAPLVTWQLHADPGRAAVDRARALTGPLADYGAGLNAALCKGTDQNTGNPSCYVGKQQTGAFLVSDGLTPLLAAFTAEDDQARTVGAFAVASLAAVALATAAVAVRLLLRRRAVELRLQRARGASATRLVLLRSAMAWPVVLVSALLGWALGLWPAPTGTSGSPQPLPALAAAVTAAVLVPLLTWFAVREPRTPSSSRPSGGATGGRRLVLELTVLLAAVAGVLALRSQGADGELSAVPVLVALAAVLLLLRVYPLVLRLLARQTRRGPGLLAFVGLSRAARDASATGLALFVLVLTLGTAVFGGLVQRTITDGAAAGAAWSTGADASAQTVGNTTPTLGAQQDARTGIRAAVEQLHTLNLVGEADGAGIAPVAVITLDPRQLAAVAPGSPLARALLSSLSTAPQKLADSSYRLPFVATPALRARERSGGFTASFQAYGQPSIHLKLEPTGTLTAAELRDPLLGPITAQLAPGTPLLLTTAAAERLLPQQSSGSTVVLLHAAAGAGNASAAALRTAGAQALGPLARIQVRSEVLAALRQDGLTHGVSTVYHVCTALAVLFGLLAVALELVLTSAERSRTTSFLRTLGLGNRAAGTLHLLQLVPLALAAALGGTLLGLLEPRLMGDALNLRQFTGGPIQPALRTDYRLTLALGAGLALLVLGAAVVETAVARGRRLGAVLRLGQS
ncbi:hypothetical protein ACEZCY_02060 [Streptacidiphilus sp. N1-12]|uniref:ABC transport system permease protein n=2 Tax=Streptacidiphilus alkalitolerans TaxID=3342712 RepID=A0ABV6V2Z4_9ACTN